MKVELVDVLTDDDLVHTGAFLEAARAVSEVAGIDVVLMMHGNSANFYHPFYRYFAERLAELGCPSLRANNRGHDVVHRPVGPRNQVSALAAYQEQPAQYFGTAYENLDDCRRDWRAWISYLWDRGYRTVLLWGHSRGAVKTAYYMGMENDPRIRACIVASPPQFSYSRWMRSPQADLFAAHLAEARGWVDKGEPDVLIRVKVPMEYMSGAATYLDKYGPEEKYDVIRHLPKIRCPVLAISGTEEVALRFGFDGLPEGFERVRQTKPDLTPLSVPGGDHLYTGKQDFVLARVLDWLKSSPRAAAPTATATVTR